MQRPKIDLAFLLGPLLLGLTMAFSAAPSLWAQQITLDDSSQPANYAAGQRSPQPHLAQQIAQADQKSDVQTQLSAKPKKNDKADDKASKPNEQKPAQQPVSKERREELLAFVEAHHPELKPLLNQLRSKRQKQFQAALLTLEKDVSRLQWLEKKSKPRYGRALDHWKIDSRIRLLSAQMAFKKSAKDKASIRKKIHTLLEQQHKLYGENTKVAIEAVKRKQERLEETLKIHEANRDSEIARKLSEIDKTSQRVSTQYKKGAEKKKSDKKEKQVNAPKDGQKKNPKPEQAKPAVKAKPAQVKPANPTKPVPKDAPVLKAKPVENAMPAKRAKPKTAPAPKPVEKIKPAEQKDNPLRE